MRISYTNLVDASTLTATSEDASYPLDNLKDGRLTMDYRSTGTDTVITVDFGAAQTAKVVAIIGHNITDSATISVNGVFTESLVANKNMIILYTISDLSSKLLTTETELTLLTEAGDELETEDFVDVDKWIISISDATNPDGYISIGRLWIGDYIQIEPSSLLDFRVTLKRSDLVIYGRDRQKFASPGIGWRKIDLSFPPSDNDMLEKLYDMYDEVGTHSSFIFCNFDTSRDYALVEPIYCSFGSDLEFTHNARQKYSYRLSIEEDK